MANVRSEALALGVLGDAYLELGLYQDAVHVLSEALPIFRDHAHVRYHGLCLPKMGYAYRGMGQHQQAAHYREDSLPMFQELRLPHYEQRAREALENTLSAASNQHGR